MVLVQTSAARAFMIYSLIIYYITKKCGPNPDFNTTPVLPKNNGNLRVHFMSSKLAMNVMP